MISLWDVPEISAAQRKSIFYPMVGQIEQWLPNLLLILGWIRVDIDTPVALIERIQSHFGLSYYFARNIFSVLFVSTGLVEAKKDSPCLLTESGERFLQTGSATTLLHVFDANFLGVAALLEVVEKHDTLSNLSLQTAWSALIRARFPQTQTWSHKTSSGQYQHRLRWLRALGFVAVELGDVRLTEQGRALVAQEPPELSSVTDYEIQKCQETLGNQTLGDFAPFEAPLTTTRVVTVRQRAFKRLICNQYDQTCVLCALRIVAPDHSSTAQAAHIIPKKNLGSDDPRNGLCLCPLCHWAFDKGLLSVAPLARHVVLSNFLSSTNGDYFLPLANRPMRLPFSKQFLPADEALEWHFKNIFTG